MPEDVPDDPVVREDPVVPGDPPVDGDEPVVDCEPLDVDVPVVVELAPVVVRVPERTFTLVEVLRPGSTTTPLRVRFLITVVLLSGAVAIT